MNHNFGRKMNIQLNKRQIYMTLITALVAMLVGTAGYAVYTQHRLENSCESNCKASKSKLIDNRCFCSTDLGWTRAGQLDWTIKKLSEKCGPLPKINLKKTGKHHK
jgi:hypothetical protein